MQKSVFGNKIGLERVIMIKLAKLSYILIVLFRDTPLAHICRVWFDGQMAINGHFGHIRPFMAIWPSNQARQIWASGVSLKRAIKMQLSSANQIIETCSNQILLPKTDFCIFYYLNLLLQPAKAWGGPSRHAILKTKTVLSFL